VSRAELRLCLVPSAPTIRNRQLTLSSLVVSSDRPRMLKMISEISSLFTIDLQSLRLPTVLRLNALFAARWRIRIPLSPPDSLGCREIRRLLVENREKWPQFCNPSLPTELAKVSCTASLAGIAGFLSGAHENSSVSTILSGECYAITNRFRLDFVTTGSLAEENRTFAVNRVDRVRLASDRCHPRSTQRIPVNTIVFIILDPVKLPTSGLLARNGCRLSVARSADLNRF
jgi:hypothetical protein